MSYRFTQAGNRLIESAAKVGKSFKPVTEAPEIQYVGAKFKRIGEKDIRERKAASGLDLPPPSLVRQYRKFQEPNNIPVHLKGGPFDYVLYYSTIGGIVISLTYAAYLMKDMMFPKKD